MKQVILIPQLVTLFLIVFETCLIFSKMRKRAHYYLFVNCIALLLYSVGSLLMLFSESEDVFYYSCMLSWAGKVGVVVSILFFCVNFFERRPSKVIIAAESLFALVTYGVIVTTKKSGLFYKDILIERERGLSFAEYVTGPWYTFWLLTIFAVIATCCIMLFRALSGEKESKKRKQYFAILIALLVELAVGFLTKLPVGKYYDFNQLGFSLCVILALLAIFRNDFMETESMAKEYIIDELSAGVIAMGPEGTVAYYNKTAAQVFPEIGYEERDVIGRIEASIRTGEPIHSKDRIYHFEERKLVQKAEDGRKMYVMIDSTKQYQHIKEVEREKQIADAANKAKTEFLAGMSHEIRTPINAILGMDEMILRECEDSTITEYATDIRAAGHTLLTIVNEILDLNKIEAGKMELVSVEYDLRGLIDNIANMIRFRAEDKELSFHVDIDPRLPKMVYGDDVKVRQVLMNLLTNAVKYTQSGDIWFRASLKKKEKGQALLRFEVEDTGIGIKDEDIHKVFSEFERVEAVKNRNIEGTGLGIPITIRLLSLMGTQLDVKSEYGMGSVFSFELVQRTTEAALPEASERTMEVPKPEPPVEREEFVAPMARVLAVDDSLINLKVFRSLLKQTQMQITEATGGKKAVELAATQQFDLIFMDHMMPGMDGVEAMKRIKAETEGPCAGTPIIVLTANAIEGSRDKYLAEGFDDYLSKPIEINLLLRMIKKYLPAEKIF